MTDHDSKNIERFCSDISPWESSYRYLGFSYFAAKQDGRLDLLQGRLFLNTSPSTIPPGHFETQSIRAGHFLLSELGLTFRDLISHTTSGLIKTPIGDLNFPKNSGNGIQTFHISFHPEGITSGNRWSVLSFHGAPRNTYFEQLALDWELKIAPKPFDSLNELLQEYRLLPYQGDFATVEVVAFQIAAIDLQSKVEGSNAKPSVILAKSLDIEKCHIAYRVLTQGQVVSRGTINGKEISWNEEEHVSRGTADMSIPSGAVLHCVAGYAGVAQHQAWLADPTTFQNPRRAALEDSDEKLEILRDYLFEEQQPRKNSRDFECGVALLLWLLGFNTAHIGGTQRMSDAADLIATTPLGNIFIVECTTGLLKAENKLAKLVERTARIKRRLISSGNGFLKVLPVIVTAKETAEIQAEMEQALKINVLVVTKETLRELLSRTITSPNAETLFEQGLQTIQSLQKSI